MSKASTGAKRSPWSAWLGYSLALAILVAAAPAAAVLCDSPSFSLCGPADDPCVIARNKPCDVTAASPIKTFDLGSRTLVVKAGATLRVSPLNPDTDPAGGMIIRARSVRLEPGGAITAPGYLRTLADATVVGVGGSVTIRTAGDVVIDVLPDGSKRSSIDVSARTNAGVIDLGAGGSILIGGILRSHANTRAGMGGRILLAGSSIGVTSSGLVDASGGDIGGSVTGTSPGGIHVDLNLTDHGTIDVSANLTAGVIDLSAAPTGPVRVDGLLWAPGTDAIGIGGTILLTAPAGFVVGGGGLLDVRGRSRAGNVVVTAGANIVVTPGTSATRGLIDASSPSSGGMITLTTNPVGDIDVGGTLTTEGTTSFGGGGAMVLKAAGNVSLRGTHPMVASGGDPDGSGGTITVNADGLIAVTGPIVNFGADGGTLHLIARGDITTGPAGRIDVGGRGAIGFGGDVDFNAGGSISVEAPVLSRGTGSQLEGGGDGETSPSRRRRASPWPDRSMSAALPRTAMQGVWISTLAWT